MKLPIETMNSSSNTIDDVSCQYEQYTGKLWDRDKCVAKYCGGLRQGKANETIDETHVRTTAILSDEVDGKHWHIVRSGVDHHERYQSFADTQASKEVPMLTTRTTNQSQTEYGHRKNTTTLNTTIVFLHTLVTITDMEELIHAHPPRETDPEDMIVWLLFKTRSGAARKWQEVFRNEVFVMAGWNAEMSACPEPDSFMVELRIYALQDVKAMKEHKLDIEMTTIIDMAEEMISKLREDIETSWQVHEGRLTKRNNKLIIITEGLESMLREEVLRLFCDHEAELPMNIPKQQSLFEQTKENWIQVIFERGVEGDQTREDIDEMSKTQETETKEQMNRVQTTLETVVQRSVRKADTRNCKAEAEKFPTFAALISAIRVIDVECANQDVNSLSAIQSESYTLDTGGARAMHTDYMERNCIERGMMKLETMIAGGLGWRTVACGFGPWSDHRGGTV